MTTSGADFAAKIGAWADKVKDNQEQVIRSAFMHVFALIIQRSPVGNPDLWNANQQAVKERNRISDINAALRASDEHSVVSKSGARRIKNGHKVVAAPAVYTSTVSPAGPAKPRLRKNAQGVNPVGKGYIGGRFRANWQIGMGEIPEGVVDDVDPSGSGSVAKMQAAVSSYKIGEVEKIYFVNNLPYGPRLEYEGHSRQAPAGMVRISCVQFEDAMNKAVLK